MDLIRFAYLVGPALAGLISSRFNPSVAIAVEAFTFLCSAVGVFFVRTRRPAEKEGEHVDVAGVRDDFLSGFRFLWHHSLLRILTILLTILTFITTGLNDVIIYRLGHELHRSDGTVGVVMSISIVGTLLASISVSALSKRFGFGPTWIAAWTLCGVAIAASAWPARCPSSRPCPR
jgi:Na+/melibiose symporter-like transporter